MRPVPNLQCFPTLNLSMIVIHMEPCECPLPRRFTVLAYLKCFVGLCKDRLEGLMASPRATLAAHCRTLALLVLLLSYDVSWVVRSL